MKVVLGADTAGFSRGMGGALASMGKFKLGVLAVGVAVVALGVKMGVTAVKAAAAFEQGMARVRAVTGATEVAFGKLGDEAKRLGKVSKFTMVEIAAGMETLGRAGFATIELVGAMGGVTALASSQMMSLAEAGEITANILRAMQIPAKDTNRVVNMLAAAAASSNTTVQSLGESFKMIAPLAAALGTSVEELGAIIGKLGDVGFRGTMATSTLATALSRLAAPPAEAQAALDELGMSIWDTRGEFIGFTAMIRELEERFVGLTTQQKQAYLGMIFGRRAIKQITALIGIGADKLEEYTESITGTNAAFDQQAIMLDTLAGKNVIFKSSIEALMTALGVHLIPTLKDLVEHYTEIVNITTDWVSGNKDLEYTIAALTNAFAKLIGLPILIKWPILQEEMTKTERAAKELGEWIEWLTEHPFKDSEKALKRMSKLLEELQAEIKAVEVSKLSDDMLAIASAFKAAAASVEDLNRGLSRLKMRGEGGLVLPGLAGLELPPGPSFIPSAPISALLLPPLVTAPIEEAIDEITTCTEDVCGVLESVTEELSAFELALLAITVADVMNAPAKMAAELRKLGEQDIVAAADRTRELIWAMEAQIDALALFGLETEEVERYLKAFQDALGGPVSALEAIKWTDVLAAPIKTAEKLAQLASEEAVAVAEYTRELIGSIETEIDALRMFGLETEETEKALALFRETIADITREGMKLSDLWSPLRSILGQLTGTMGQLATSLVDLVQSFVEGGLSITNVTSAITFFVSMILGFIRKSIADLEKQIQDFEEQIRGLEEEIRMLEEEIRTFEEQIRDLEEVLAFYISTFEKIASVMNSLLSVLGPLGSVIGATVQAFVSAIKMTTLTGIELLNAGISMLTNYLNSLISTVLGLIQKSDAYQAVQEQGSRAWKAISDLFGQFLWPLAALLKHIMDWLGIQEKVKEAAAVEIGVPSAWKRMRRAYEAAAPGEIVREARGIEIPAWATALVEGIAEAIEGVLEKFGISSWTNLLEAFKQGSIKFWTYVQNNIPKLVSALTAIFNTISDAIGGGVVDTIVGWLQKGFDWLINVAPRAVADFIRFTKMIWSLIGTVWNWLRTLDWDDIWRRIEDKFGEFGRTLEDLLDFTDTISAIDRIANEIRKLVTEIGRITTEIGKVRIAIEGVEREIERLKTVMKYIILMAAGAITGAIIGAAGFLSPAALIGALAGATAGGFLAWLSGQEAKGTGMEWVSTGRGEGYWRRPRSFQLGGVVPGPIGAPRLARVHGGEEIRTYAQRQQQQPTQVFTEVHVYMGADEVTDFVVERIRHTSKLLTGSRSTAAGLTRRAYA